MNLFTPLEKQLGVTVEGKINSRPLRDYVNDVESGKTPRPNEYVLHILSQNVDATLHSYEEFKDRLESLEHDGWDDVLYDAVLDQKIYLIERTLLQKVTVEFEVVMLASECDRLGVLKHFTKTDCKPPLLEDALYKASRNGSYSVVKYLIKKRSVDPTTGNNFAAALALENGKIKVLRYLVKNGADITSRAKVGLERALNGAHGIDVARYLIDEAHMDYTLIAQIAVDKDSIAVLQMLDERGLDLSSVRLSGAVKYSDKIRSLLRKNEMRSFEKQLYVVMIKLFQKVVNPSSPLQISPEDSDNIVEMTSSFVNRLIENYNNLSSDERARIIKDVQEYEDRLEVEK